MSTVTRARQTVHRVCPACSTDNAFMPVHRYSHHDWPLKKCRGCGFVYIEKAPVYEELVDEFAWEKTSLAREQERRRQHPLLHVLSKKTRWRLHLFKRRNLDAMLSQYVCHGNILDIGCGKGDQLKLLSSCFTPYGIEISKAEAVHARRQVEPLGGRIIVDSAVAGLQAFATNFFSGVLMRSYLEHEAAPKAVLQDVYRTLQPGGVTIIKVPNYGSLNRRVFGQYWCGFRFPDHLNYFTPHSLVKLCSDCNLRPLRFGWRERLPISDNLWLMAGK